MELRERMAGGLAVGAAITWATLIVAQMPRYQLALAIVLGSSEPASLRWLMFPSLLHGGTGMILAFPLALVGVAGMLRVSSLMRTLHALAITGLATSSALVLVFGIMAAGSLGSVGRLPLGPGAVLELTGAANLVLLHAAITYLLVGRRLATTAALA